MRNARMIEPPNLRPPRPDANADADADPDADADANADPDANANADANAVPLPAPAPAPDPDPDPDSDPDPVRPLPSGRAIASLSSDACFALLADHDVAFERADAPGLDMGVRLRGPVGGIAIGVRSRAPSVHALLDCRLVVALLAWSPSLRGAGITRIDHYSVYRAGARVASTGHASGHSRGLAIDAALFTRSDGTALDVWTAWGDRTGDVCAQRADEASDARLLRDVVCDAIARDLFQVVITPHHDDAHQNHVHLEVVPGVPWSYVR